MAITGITFSPIGEELFFRGIIHSSFAKSIGDKKASLVDNSHITFWLGIHKQQVGLFYNSDDYLGDKHVFSEFVIL